MYTYIYTWKKKSNNKNSQGERELFKSECWRRDTDSPPPPPKKKISSSKKKKAHTKPEQPLSPRVHGDRSQREKKSRKKSTATPFSIRDTLRGNSLADPDRPRKGLLPPWRTRERDNEPAPPSPCNAPLSPPLFFFFLSHVERRQKYRCATICIPGKKIKRKKKGGASGKGETKNEDGARKKRGKKGGIVGKIRIN